VRLPLGARSHPSAPQSEARLELEPVPPVRILVLDDEADIRTLLEILLTGWGHVVWSAGTGVEAIERAAAMRPDLVLLDIGLPDMDGYEVATRVRAELGEAAPRIVAVTGYGQAEDRSRFERAAIDEYLLKPPTRDALQRVIEKVARSGARPPR
jgi:CheY-like chemotaxis protein